MAQESAADGASRDEEAWKAQDAADDQEIRNLLAQSSGPGEGPSFILDDRPFDQTDKADDAQDFEDISDDDLPEEEEGNAGTSLEVPGLTDDGGTSNDTDDLFGEGIGSSPPHDLLASSPTAAVRDEDPSGANAVNFRDLNFDPDPTLDNQDPDIPAAAESKEDLIKQAWPEFRRGVVLEWSKLLPSQKAAWVQKKPGKKPKPLLITKMSLDLDVDQEKLFRIPGPAVSTRRQRAQEMEARGLVYCGPVEDSDDQDAEKFDIDNDSDSELVGGFSLRDIELTCTDWTVAIDRPFAPEDRAPESRKRRAEDSDDDEDDWDAEFLQDAFDDGPRRKKRRTIPSGLPRIPHYTAAPVDSFEEATKKSAKRVYLDMSDPHLFLETQEPERGAKRARMELQNVKRMASGRLGRDVLHRFNHSNDEAYEALKENHQSKVRATLGNLSVEHSMPALKLTWPYYQVKFHGTPDTYHRPRFRTQKFSGLRVDCKPLAAHKRKHMKGKAHEVFKECKDLSLGDNSTSVLFEYCERVPRVLSKFGMGNRVINYYRRKEGSEEQPPKSDIGESHVLLPEDRSPFNIFGTVDPGETVPTLHNQMYRAPVFKHSPRNTDFILGRTSTGTGGSNWYVRKVDHIFVVGQTFPSVEVPGPHSRKVTNASKHRMRMLAYRMIRKDPHKRCQLSDITRHIADSTDAQNRQKLKEFLQYERKGNSDTKGTGLYKLKEGDTLPDESIVRTMIKAEDVCLIDAMHLGMKELEDAGFDPRNAVIEDEGEHEEEDEEGEGGGKKKQVDKGEETLSSKLAPWKTTKAFIDACNQKAMLQLHGDGDPTGKGLGFSFIRTSMKGGYIEAVQGPLATSADALERENKRANGGHAYNVKRQQKLYEQGISNIWERQKSTLSDPTVHDDNDVSIEKDEDDRFNTQAAATPAHVDEGTSQISGFTSSTNRNFKKRMRITRTVRLPDGRTETRSEIVEDPVVMAHYIKKKNEVDSENRDLYKLQPSGNADQDRHEMARVKKELDRLEKNKARRQAREQQKELQRGGAGSPEPGAADKAPAGTTRKCANCGQVGHIKTNKKLCPMLNGTMKTDNGLAEHGGFGVYNAPSQGAD